MTTPEGNTPAPPAVLGTTRLVLRQPTDDDAPAIVEVSAPLEVVRGTLTLPHPYTLDDARVYLERVQRNAQTGPTTSFAITLREPPCPLIGLIGLHYDPLHEHAELGYILHMGHWGRGYISEAIPEMLRYGFDVLKLQRIHAGWYSDNPASGRVLEKAGFVREGLRPRLYKRFGVWKDVVLVRMLESEWRARGR